MESHYVVRQEANRLIRMSRVQARQQLGDRIARTFQLDGAERAEALDFNARLVTEIRAQAEALRTRHLWEAM